MTWRKINEDGWACDRTSGCILANIVDLLEREAQATDPESKQDLRRMILSQLQRKREFDRGEFQQFGGA